MTNEGKRYLVSGAMAIGGMVFFAGGLEMVHRGKEDMETAVYDPLADKYDVAEASLKYMKKVIIGAGLSTIGGALIGGAVANAFDAGVAGGLKANEAPVMISANTLEEAQGHLDAMRRLMETAAVGSAVVNDISNS